MDDLFAQGSQLEALNLADAQVLYQASLSLPLPSEALLDELVLHTPWRLEPITVWGKTHWQPRLMAWYGDPASRYTYSGIALQPLPWTPRLLEIKAAVEAASSERFNSVLLNLYRNERDSMGMHSDDEPELGPQPVIASLSLGQERALVFKHKTRADLKSVSVLLASGSLLLMRGDTQQHWKHGINKSAKPIGPRLNLTFRQIHSR
jgi:alkylated DNA repair dioxygenase AlkB